MPVLHAVEQDSEEWHRLRMGIPTSSEFHRIITAKERRRSAQWQDYAYRLLAERVLLRPVDQYRSAAMERGQIVQHDAALWYEMSENMETHNAGFITSDTWYTDSHGRQWYRYGCSPDRIVGEDGILEIKCPLPNTQMKYWFEKKADSDHIAQLQGQLFVSEREWVDILCWHEELPKVILRVERDEGFIRLLEAYLREMNEFLDGVMNRLAEVDRRPIPKQHLRDALRDTLEGM